MKDMFTPYLLLKKSFDIADIVISHIPSSRELDVISDKQVSALWANLVKKSKKTWRKRFDGMFYRVENVEDLSAGDQIHIELSTINYRYVCGHVVKSLYDIYSKSKNTHPQHLATAAMILTTDGYRVFGQRSDRDAVDLIWWGTGPDDVMIHTWSDLLTNLKKELREEAWIQDEHIDTLVWIGMLSSFTTNIIMMTEVKLTVTRQELDTIFASRTDDEMSSLIYIPEGEIDLYMEWLPSYRPLICELI